MALIDTNHQLTLAARMDGLRSSALRDLLAVAGDPTMISLAGGLPDPDAFPVRELRRSLHRRLRTNPARLLQYGPTEGDPALRHWIALDEGRRHDRPVPDTGVLVTSGAQQGIDLVGRVLVDPGTPVAVEAPAYLGAIQALSVHQPDLVGIPTDEAGLQVDRLEARLAAGFRPRLLYVVSTFQNPTGTTLPLDRRRRLGELADRYGFWIVDDDPYHELRFEGAPLPPIGAFTHRAIRLGTFSKTLAPGLRVGWLVAPPELVGPLVRAKQAADLQPSSLAQPVVADLVAGAGYGHHLNRLRDRYRERAAALGAALDGAFGDHLAWVAPAGGMFLWARFTDGTDTSALLGPALDRGVAYVPGAEFHLDRAPSPWLRLSFATSRPDRLAEAAHRLRDAWRSHPAR